MKGRGRRAEIKGFYRGGEASMLDKRENGLKLLLRLSSNTW
jgi:hypothetical protein